MTTNLFIPYVLTIGRNLALKQQATDPIPVDGDTSNSNCLNSSSWRVSLARPSYINSIIIHTDNVCINPYFDQGCASMHQRTCRPEFCHNVESSCLECMPPYRVCENDAQHKYTDIANPLIRDCEHGTYGQGCGLNCSVKCENQTCDSITGRCLSCPPGWRGDYCEQDCDKHYYGKNCTETCSENCVDQLCNITDGVCLSCPVGRLGDFCDKGGWK
ncbi:protein draper-like [Physella acuta]|uniref:protein draper-like n=1 Tax=Physella acuta TaxID=109671 RepID=UPI0027DD1D99|nr:protein draper-like [Physella acuta]